MTADLHARLVAALDEEQARAEAATPGPWLPDGYDVVAEDGWIATVGEWREEVAANVEHIAAQDPARTLARIAADRRVLERHEPVLGDEWSEYRCVEHVVGCIGHRELAHAAYPCDEVRDLAARYGVEVEP